MEFAQPYYLLLIFLLLILIFWYYYYGNLREASIRYSNIKIIPNDILLDGKRKNNFLISLRFLIMILIIIALARPRLINTMQKSKTEIVDINLYKYLFEMSPKKIIFINIIIVI